MHETLGKTDFSLPGQVSGFLVPTKRGSCQIRIGLLSRVRDVMWSTERGKWGGGCFLLISKALKTVKSVTAVDGAWAVVGKLPAEEHEYALGPPASTW